MLPVCFANELNLVYDANGNLVSGDGKYREYNSLNQLSKVYNGSDTSGILLEEYWHHPTQERVLKKKVYNNDSSLKETVYYISKNFVRVVNSSGSYDFTYVYHNGQLVAQVNPDGSKYFIHTDHIGSVSVVTNESGDVIENTTYSPFGEIVEGGTTSRYDYEGQEYDSVVGDYDFNFRKYKAEWALFTQPDTLIQNVYDPQSLNRYMFERGNPYRYTDESGHSAFLFIMGIIGGILALSTVFLFNFGMPLLAKKGREKDIEENTQMVLDAIDMKYDESNVVEANLQKEASVCYVDPESIPVEEPEPEDEIEDLEHKGKEKEPHQESPRSIEQKTPSSTKGVSGDNKNQNQFTPPSSYSYGISVSGGGTTSSRTLRSMSNTLRSGSSVTWYYSKSRGTYTYRVGGKSAGSGYSRIRVRRTRRSRRRSRK